MSLGGAEVVLVNAGKHLGLVQLFLTGWPRLLRGAQWRGEGITSLRSHDAVGRIAALLIRDVVGQSL